MFDALKVVKSQLVSISFNGEMKPFVIKSIDDDNLIQLVLPVRTYA